MRVLILGVLLVAVPVVCAQEKPEAFRAKTAKELKDACTATGKQAPMMLYCAGFVEATAWLSAMPTADGSGVRYIGVLTETYTIEQFINAFLVYINQHPEEDQHPAQLVLQKAWADHKMLTYKSAPCLESKP